MDKETLYELRSLLALYPYFQTARLLMLQNLYLLHDPTFDEELRRAAIYITDRKVVFNLVEAAHYRLSSISQNAPGTKKTSAPAGQDSRTATLINQFLDNIPVEKEEQKGKRKPTPSDAAVDYVSYLIETEGEAYWDEDQPQMRGQNLIDNFINKEGILDDESILKEKKFRLKKDKGEIALKKCYVDELGFSNLRSNGFNPCYNVYKKENKIFIKFEALEIIKRLNLNYPKKNAYFADQIRFLEKLIINNNKK